MRNKLGLLALLLVASCSLQAQISGKPPAQTIPDFKFFRFDNTTLTNKDLPSGKLIFFMFVDPDCDHCQHAMKTIGEQYPSFQKTAIFIVSMFDQNKINHFMDTYGSKLKGRKNVTILQDKLQRFIIKFNPVKYPSMFLYSPEKKLLDYEDNPESIFRLVNAIKKNA